MTRYYIKYNPDNSTAGEVLSYMHIGDRTVYHPHKNRLTFSTLKGNDREAKITSALKDKEVIADEFIGIIDIALSDAEVATFKGTQYTIQKKPLEVVRKTLDTFDPPGTEPHFLFDTPNPWSQTINRGSWFPSGPFNDPDLPYQIDCYGDSFENRIRWSRYPGCLRSGPGDIIQPTLKYWGLDKLWAKGYRGQGVKIGVLDLGCPLSFQHESLQLVDSYNPNGVNGLETTHAKHAIGACTAIGGKAGVLGGAPDCLLYAANWSDVNNSMSWLMQQGIRVITMSFSGQDIDIYFNALVAKHWKDGGVVLIAGGNDQSQLPLEINNMCAVPHAYAIGGQQGGGPFVFKEHSYSDNVLPYHGKNLDFLAPDVWLGAWCNDGDPYSDPNWSKYYWYDRGSSMSNHITAGLVGCLMSQRPYLPGRIIMNDCKIHQRVVFDGATLSNGYPRDGFPVFDLSFATK